MEKQKSPRINSWCGWHPLEEVWVGRNHDPSYFDTIKNNKIASPLKRIAEETEEDYQNLIKILKDYGVKKILRPSFFEARYGEQIPNHATNPRDHHFVYGNKLFRFEAKDCYNKLYDEYRSENEFVYDPYSDKQNNIKSDLLPAPSCVRFGDAILVDQLPYDNYKWFKENFTDTKIFTSLMGGHSDACFCPVNSKLIVTLNDYKENFKDTIFKNYEFLYLENESWEKVQPISMKGFEMLKATKGRWYLAGEQSNTELINFVDTYLQDWVGYCSESVFDVNMMVLDEHNVIVNAYNKKIFDTFKRHKIEPIICTLRHRYFWDGGLHCNTLDIRRNGKKEQYLNY